jgi:hypothetical protein
VLGVSCQYFQFDLRQSFYNLINNYKLTFVKYIFFLEKLESVDFIDKKNIIYKGLSNYFLKTFFY